MATKHQTFKIKVSEKYTDREKRAIAKDVIDFVVERTLKGKDKNNQRFTPGYSKEYAKSAEGQAAGKRRGAIPNLRLSGDMLNALGQLIRIKPRSVEIGYKAGTKENAKADGNVRGTYGNNRPVTNGRDFMGITDSDLEKIKDNFPLDDKEKRKASVSEVYAAAKAAREALSKKETK